MPDNVITVTPDNVRAAIDVSLAAQNLPNAVIELDIYKGRAIRTIQARDPDYATRTGAAAAHLNTAADLLTASKAVFVVPAVKAQTFAQNQGYTREALDPEVVSARLIAEAEDELNEVLTPGDDPDVMPTMFTLACGRRGR